MKNAVTIDLEDYYQVSAFASGVAVDAWESFASRIEANTDRLLQILDAAGRKATFFTLGWVAKKYPRLVRKVAAHGHEIACHSNTHRLVYSMSPAEFRDDTRQAKELLEEAGGTAVRGYRAPSFSITGKSLWAFEVLADLGFRYDSSVFPVRHPNYGMPQAPRAPFAIKTASGSIVEFPMPTLEMRGVRAPLAGGAYLRLLPYWYTRWGIRFINEKENRSACVYVHPWELDSEQPRMKGSASARLRHYLGLRGAESKLRRLLQDFEMQPLGSLVEELGRESSLGSAADIPEIPLGELGAYLEENGHSPQAH
jgi:polysaccharide deacetylase family protein (PEP-CTERM system associated)